METLKFDSCPVCGSTRRLAGSIGDRLKEEDKALPESNFALIQAVVPIVDPNKPSRVLVGASVPVAIAIIDACMDCGCLYTLRQTEQAAQTTTQGPQGGQPFTPFRGN